MEREALKLEIESQWISRAKTQGLKPGSASYKRAELEFFLGAMTAIHLLDASNKDSNTLSPMVPVSWVINPMTGSPIVDINKGT